MDLGDFSARSRAGQTPGRPRVTTGKQLTGAALGEEISQPEAREATPGGSNLGTARDRVPDH